jgi:hypothetical protein
VAGILAGFFPFGVGAVYTGQYAKGLAHLAIFALLIAGINAAEGHGSDALETISIFGLVFFIVYQIIDAVRSARAIQAGLPAPDPYGLGATFGGGAKIETSKVPMGAIVLILVGVLFLLHTLGLTEFGLDRFWPLILIFLGAWLFARNWGLLGPGGCSGCQCARCRCCPACTSANSGPQTAQTRRWASKLSLRAGLNRPSRASLTSASNSVHSTWGPRPARFWPGGVGVPCLVSCGITSPAYMYVVGAAQVPRVPG